MEVAWLSRQSTQDEYSTMCSNPRNSRSHDDERCATSDEETFLISKGIFQETCSLPTPSGLGGWVMLSAEFITREISLPLDDNKVVEQEWLYSLRTYQRIHVKHQLPG